MANQSSQSTARSTTRRNALKGAAAGGALLLAGCSSQQTGQNTNGNSTSSTGTSSGGTSGRLDRTCKTVAQTFSPTELQYNDLNPKNYGGDITAQMVYERFIWYVPGNDEYVPRVFSDWSFDGKKLTATVDTNYKWHNGDQLTVQDVLTHWKLQIYRDSLTIGQHPYFDSVEKTGENEVTFTMHQAFNSDLVIQSNFVRWNSGRMLRKHSVYKDWLQRFEDASSKDERMQVLTELQRMRLEEPVGTGPFKYDTANEQYFQDVAFDDYPMADNINYTTDRINAYQSMQQMVSAISNAEVDTAEAFSPQPKPVMQQWPDDRQRLEAPNFGGRAILFNNERVSDPRVRQAIAYAINQQNIGTNLPPNQTGLKRNTGGIYEGAREMWLGDLVDSFPSYQQDLQKATQLLNDAGYEKQDGTWVSSSSGDPLKLNFVSPPWSDTWTPVAKTAGSQLQNFGIKAQVTVSGGATWSNATEQGDFDMTVWDWGGSPHPFFEHQDVFQRSTAETASIGSKKVWEATPVGKPNGSLQEYDITSLLDTVRTASERSAAKAAVQKLAWVYATRVPIYPVTEGYMTHWVVRTNRFKVDAKDEAHRHVNDPLNDLPRTGEFHAVSE